MGTLDFRCFVDELTGVLAKPMCRFNSPDDPIHLGSTGIFMLSRLMSGKILSHTVDSRAYSDVTGLTNRRPVSLHTS